MFLKSNRFQDEGCGWIETLDSLSVRGSFGAQLHSITRAMRIHIGNIMKDSCRNSGI